MLFFPQVGYGSLKNKIPLWVYMYVCVIGKNIRTPICFKSIYFKTSNFICVNFCEGYIYNYSVLYIKCLLISKHVYNVLPGKISEHVFLYL